MAMPNWLWIVVLIVSVLAAGMLRERLRLRGVDDGMAPSPGRADPRVRRPVAARRRARFEPHKRS
jgi:hypothetical protein